MSGDYHGPGRDYLTELFLKFLVKLLAIATFAVVAWTVHVLRQSLTDPWITYPLIIAEGLSGLGLIKTFLEVLVADAAERLSYSRWLRKLQRFFQDSIVSIVGVAWYLILRVRVTLKRVAKRGRKPPLWKT